MIPVRKTDVVLGKPLPYSLFDSNNKLLLRAGVIVQTQNQLDVLSERGLYRDKVSNTLPSVTARAGQDAEPKPEADKGGILLDLEEIRLQIGDVLQLQAAGEDSQRYTLRLLGYSKGRSVMVTAPMVDGGYAIVKQDAAFVVRFFSGKSVYAFPAHVLKMANTPFPYLHLSYPKKVRGMRVRRGQRAAVRIIAAVTDAAGKPHAATLIDISKGGALLAAKATLGATGDAMRCKFRLQFDDIDQFVQVGVVIRSVSNASEPENEAVAVNHGVEFTDVPEQDRLALTAFVYHQLIQASEGG
ncbi:MAG TPA: flagellar brake protein [Methyloversatilis sp.]